MHTLSMKVINDFACCLWLAVGFSSELNADFNLMATKTGNVTKTFKSLLLSVSKVAQC